MSADQGFSRILAVIDIVARVIAGLWVLGWYLIVEFGQLGATASENSWQAIGLLGLLPAAVFYGLVYAALKAAAWIMEGFLD